MFGNTNNQQDIPDYKKRRDDQTKSIRRDARHEVFSKKRHLLMGQGPSELTSASNQKKDRLLIVDQRYSAQIETFLRSTYSMDIFPELIQNLNDPNILRQHQGMIGIRKILSIAENPPIQAVIDAGLVPKMIEYVKQGEYPQLQLEATWALTNVASGSTVQCQSIIDKGGIPLFVTLLKSPTLGIVEQAIWAVGNIASDCTHYRDTIIRHGGLKSLVEVVKQLHDDNLIKHCCWALSNLCRGTPLPKYDAVHEAIPILCKAVGHGRLNDKDIISDCCWAISYHSDGNKNKIQVVVSSGLIPRLVKHLDDPSMGILIPSIRILGNISTGSVDHGNELLNQNVLDPLEKVLDHFKKVVRRQACWVVSNLTAGSRSQVETVLSRNTLITKILAMFETDASDVKRQICYIFSNMAHSGQPQLIYNLYRDTNIIRYYVNLLNSEESKTIQIALECLYIILSQGDMFKGNGKNPLVMELHSMGAIELLEKLQFHKSDSVYENVSKILQGFFDIQDPLEM